MDGFSESSKRHGKRYLVPFTSYFLSPFIYMQIYINIGTARLAMVFFHFASGKMNNSPFESGDQIYLSVVVQTRTKGRC